MTDWSRDFWDIICNSTNEVQLYKEKFKEENPDMFEDDDENENITEIEKETEPNQLETETKASANQ